MYSWTISILGSSAKCISLVSRQHCDCSHRPACSSLPFYFARSQRHMRFRWCTEKQVFKNVKVSIVTFIQGNWVPMFLILWRLYINIRPGFSTFLSSLALNGLNPPPTSSATESLSHRTSRSKTPPRSGSGARWLQLVWVYYINCS